MSITLAGVAFLLLTDHYMTAFIFILLFIGTFQVGTGSVGLIYCVEVPVDKTSGIVGSGAFIAIFMFNISMEYMLVSL